MKLQLKCQVYFCERRTGVMSTLYLMTKRRSEEFYHFKPEVYSFQAPKKHPKTQVGFFNYQQPEALLGISWGVPFFL